MKLKNLLFGICLFAGVGAYAHDFSATVNGQRLYFDITNKAKKTVAVTYNGSIADKKAPELSGVVEIPSKVKHNNVVYAVTTINQKAFANANRLQGVVIPSGVETIGDFAFENCDSLENIVFPGNPVSLGQGVFFNCTTVSNVTIGSDWKTIDFAMFRWSKSLNSVNIPAKVEKIQGLKKLKYLTSITVDPNNSKFSSFDGMLYSKDGSIYYACPRAYKGKVVIKDGVTKVLSGSLIDCTEITSIDIPASVQTISFRETSRMEKLELIVLRSEKPIYTGYFNGVGKFLFQLVGPKVQIVVPSSSKKIYEDALADKAGEYSESVDGVPYMVTQPELPTKKSIKGVKNVDKY